MPASNVRSALIAACAAALLTALPVMAEEPQPEAKADPKLSEIKAMRWVEAGPVEFPNSNSGLTLAPGVRAVTARDASRLAEIINGTPHPDTEGVVILPDSMIYLSYQPSGYVTVDDWKDLNADDLLANMQKGLEESNAERRHNGSEALHLDGWLQRPQLDHQLNRVTWATNLHDDDGHKLVNAIALKLGRGGYEQLTWVVDPEAYASSTSFNTFLERYEFDAGKRYADHADGDKVAEYGIAGLVGAVVGVKVAKVLGIGALLLGFKKLIILPVLAAGGGWRWVKRRFGRGET